MEGRNMNWMFPITAAFWQKHARVGRAQRQRDGRKVKDGWLCEESKLKIVTSPREE